jgi:hypothetical protein
MRKEINIDERIQKRIFLAPHEIEDLIEFTSFNFEMARMIILEVQMSKNQLSTFGLQP